MSTPNPFNCIGCHTGDFADFDHYCDTLNVQTSELPHAFAAWLGHKTGWDGHYEPVTCPHGRTEGHWYKNAPPFFTAKWCPPPTKQGR